MDILFFVGCNKIDWLFKNDEQIKKVYDKLNHMGIIVNYEHGYSLKTKKSGFISMKEFQNLKKLSENGIEDILNTLFEKYFKYTENGIYQKILM